MKTAIMWVVLVIVALGIFLVFAKTSILTEAFDDEASH